MSITIIIPIWFRVTDYPGKSPQGGKEDEKLVLASGAMGCAGPAGGLGAGGSVQDAGGGTSTSQTTQRTPRTIIGSDSFTCLSELPLITSWAPGCTIPTLKAPRAKLWGPQETSPTNVPLCYQQATHDGLSPSSLPSKSMLPHPDLQKGLWSGHVIAEGVQTASVLQLFSTDRFEPRSSDWCVPLPGALTLHHLESTCSMLLDL